LANLCLGVFFNLSIWYKLTEQTRFGTYLTLWGAAITLALNFYWIPLIGYMGAAWATLLCYLSMAVWSYLLGQKFYKVPYDLGRMIAYPVLAVALYLWAEKIQGLGFVWELAARNAVLMGFVGLVVVLEKSSGRSHRQPKSS
jgi:O-antigen/teichoic acid export membrane protein